MKRLNLLPIALLVCSSSFVTAQTATKATKAEAKPAKATTASATPKTTESNKPATATATAESKSMYFMDRYYAIKATYPDMKDAYGKFAASTQSMDKFVER
jgi:hypothetical protein